MENAMSNRTYSKRSSGLQGDLLSGEWTSRMPKRGDGQHIRLKSLVDSEPVAVPGMAGFSGAGPKGTYCQDCVHFADEIAVQTSSNTIEKTKAGCEVWAQRMGHAAPSPRRDIRLCPSCKLYEKPADATPRCFIIDSTGSSRRVESMPEDLRAWLRRTHSREAGELGFGSPKGQAKKAPT